MKWHPSFTFWRKMLCGILSFTLNTTTTPFILWLPVLAWSIRHWQWQRSEFVKEVDLAIQMGVAGSFQSDLALGTVVEVTSDRFADLGVEEADGSFTDVYEMDLCEKDGYPFEDGWLKPGKQVLKSGLKEVRSLTVNKVHGHELSIDRITKKYNADIESMEGAAFFYACRLMDVRCMQIRAISNRVEPRNRAAWELAKAIDNLNGEMIRLIQQA